MKVLWLSLILIAVAIVVGILRTVVSAVGFVGFFVSRVLIWVIIAAAIFAAYYYITNML